MNGPRLNTVSGRPISNSTFKAPGSTSAALRGGRECNSKNRAEHCLRGHNYMVNELRKQALASNIKRLKRDIRCHEERRQEIILELQCCFPVRTTRNLNKRSIKTDVILR